MTQQWNDMFENCSCFLGGISDYQEAQAVLIGLPMDWTTSFRPGTRRGPAAIRAASVGLEEFSFAQERSLEDLRYHDAGDVILPLGNVGLSLQRIRQVADKVFANQKWPLFWGGEHLVSLPVIEAAAVYYPDLVVIQLDAHADLRSDYLGESFSHAAVMRHVVGKLGSGRVYQLGIRSGTRAELDYARQYTVMHQDVLANLDRVIKTIGSRPVYLTLDIDVVDPAFAPGTGTPEPGGLTSQQLFQTIRLLSQLQVIGMDIVEVAPVYDQAEITALLAAKVTREVLLGCIHASESRTF